MMNIVRKRAKLMRTEFGGVCCKPIAERSSESTTIMRVKLVTMTRMLGARLKIVVMAMIWTMFDDKDELPEPILTFKGSADASDGSANARRKKNILKKIGLTTMKLSLSWFFEIAMIRDFK